MEHADRMAELSSDQIAVRYVYRSLSRWWMLLEERDNIFMEQREPNFVVNNVYDFAKRLNIIYTYMLLRSTHLLVEFPVTLTTGDRYPLARSIIATLHPLLAAPSGLHLTKLEIPPSPLRGLGRGEVRRKASSLSLQPPADTRHRTTLLLSEMN